MAWHCHKFLVEHIESWFQELYRIQKITFLLFILPLYMYHHPFIYYWITTAMIDSTFLSVFTTLIN